MIFSLFRTISLRYISHHPVRALLIILSIALGVATWVATDALQLAMKDTTQESVNPSSNADLYVNNDVTQWISRSLREKIEQVDGVKRAEPRVISVVTVQTPAIVQARLFGINLALEQGETPPLEDWNRFDVNITQEDLQAYALARLTRKIPGLKMSPPALVGEQLANKLKEGQKELTMFASGKKKKIFVAGRIHAKGTGATLGGNVIVMDGRDAANLFGQSEQVTRFDVIISADADRAQVEQQLKETIQTANVQTPEAQNRRIQNLIRGMEIGFRICGAGALVVGLFLVFNALSISVVERRHDIGILRSLGATRPQIRILFLLEALVLGVIGTILGIPMGMGLAHLSFDWIQQLYEGVFTRIAGGEVQMATSTIITASIGGVFVSLFAALLPASQAASEEPADTVRRAPYVAGRAYRLLQIGSSVGLIFLGGLLVLMKPYLSITLIAQSSLILLGVGVVCLIVTVALGRGAERQIEPMLWPTILGALMVLFGAVAWLFQEELDPDKISYVGFVLVLLGVMLATPLLTVFVAKLIQPIARTCLPISSRLAADNLVRSPGRTGLVIAALTAGVAMMVQTAGTILSNESAFDNWISRHYRADLFVTSGGPFSSSGLLTTMDLHFGEDVKRVIPTGTEVVPSAFRYPAYDSPKIGETRIFLTLIDTTAHYRVNRQLRPDGPYLELYRNLSEHDAGVVISENFARMHGLKIDDTLSLKGSEGPIQFQVLGIIEEYNWNRGSIIMDLNRFKDDFRARSPVQIRDMVSTMVGLNATPGPSAIPGSFPLWIYGGGMVDAFEIYLPPDADINQVREELLRELGPQYALVALTRPELQEKIRDVLRRFYGVAYAQELLIGVVAVLGVITALLISVLSRRRELGLIRAVGGTRAQLLQTVLAEAVLIGFVGTLLGVLVGIPLEHYVVRVVLFEEMGYLFPVTIPWAATAIIAVAAILCSTLAGIGPAVHAMRLKIADAVAYE